MRSIVSSILMVARILAVCAGIAGVGAGLLFMTFIAGLTCFNSCPTREQYFTNLPRGTLWVMLPAIVLGGLALLAYSVYCGASHQTHAIRLPVVAVAVACVALALFDQVAYVTPNMYGESLVAWTAVWGLALVAISVAWSWLLVRCAGAVQRREVVVP